MASERAIPPVRPKSCFAQRELLHISWALLYLRSDWADLARKRTPAAPLDACGRRLRRRAVESVRERNPTGARPFRSSVCPHGDNSPMRRCPAETSRPFT